ncbi:MAG: hypothetical protein ACETWG_10440 [Candidatus Neomarinimicrobiota bacterium]
MKSQQTFPDPGISREDDPFESLRQAKPSRSFQEMAHQLAAASEAHQHRPRTQLGNLAMPVRVLLSRPALAAYAAALLLIGACNVPTEYSKTIGYSMRVSAEGNPQTIVEKVKSQAGEALSNVEVTIDQLSDGAERSEMLFTFSESTIDHQALSRQVKALEGVQLVTVEPIDHEFRGNLLTGLLHKTFDVEINITDLTEAQVEQAIREELESWGLDADVTYSRSEDEGKERIEIKATIDDTTAVKEPVRIKLVDENNPEDAQVKKRKVVRKKLQQ